MKWVGWVEMCWLGVKLVVNEFLIYRNLGCLDCQGNGRLDLLLYS